MDIGGLQKVSLSDYPGQICAVVFTRGCNFRCPFCHNPELVEPGHYAPSLHEAAVFSFLEQRRGRLDAVTVTGGEPTLQPDLPRALGQLKDMGYLVKLDTNGSRPAVVEHLLREGLVDYVAMDIKGPLDKYAAITRWEGSGEEIRQSIAAIMTGRVAYEFRTTVVKSLLTPEDLLAAARLVRHARRYVLQRFVPAGILDRELLSHASFSEEEFAVLRREVQKEVDTVTIR
jgi:pyruvate formate lyase activating enzyme